MSGTRRFPLLLLLSALCGADTRCAPTSFYRNCWIRRFPGIFIDVDESARRGAQLLRGYEENSALQCSRSCCLSRNFSCNLAVFHYDTVQESVNCFHLYCPTMESCVPKLRGNVILYNITAGADPDLLVFGKFFSNTRAWPQLSSRLNSSEVHVSDKRHFNRLPMAPVLPRTVSSSPKPSNKFIISSAAVTPPPPPVPLAASSARTFLKSQSILVTPMNTKPPPNRTTSTHIHRTVFSNGVTHKTSKMSPTVVSTPTTSNTAASPTFTTSRTSPKEASPTFTTSRTSPKEASPTFTTSRTSPKASSSTFTTSRTSPKAASPTFTTSRTSPKAASPTFTTSRTSPKAASSAFTTSKGSATEGSPTYTIPTTSTTAANSTKTLSHSAIIGSSVTQITTSSTHNFDSLSPITDRFASSTITTLHILSSSTSFTSSTQATGDTSISTTRSTTLVPPSRSPGDQLTPKSWSSVAPSYPKPSSQLINAAPLDSHVQSLPIGPANIDSGKQHPNDTKDYANWNHTTGEGEESGENPGPETAAWYAAAKALLVPVVVSSSILLSCCCSVLLAFSWRDKKKGRYRKAWGKKKGSMRLVKYVIVRESF